MYMYDGMYVCCSFSYQSLLLSRFEMPCFHISYLQFIPSSESSKQSSCPSQTLVDLMRSREARSDAKSRCICVIPYSELPATLFINTSKITSIRT